MPRHRHWKVLCDGRFFLFMYPQHEHVCDMHTGITSPEMIPKRPWKSASLTRTAARPHFGMMRFKRRDGAAFWKFSRSRMRSAGRFAVTSTFRTRPTPVLIQPTQSRHRLPVGRVLRPCRCWPRAILGLRRSPHGVYEAVETFDTVDVNSLTSRRIGSYVFPRGTIHREMRLPPADMLVGRDTRRRRHNQVNRMDPCQQRQMRAVHWRARCNRELVVARDAISATRHFQPK